MAPGPRPTTAIATQAFAWWHRLARHCQGPKCPLGTIPSKGDTHREETVAQELILRRKIHPRQRSKHCRSSLLFTSTLLLFSLVKRVRRLAESEGHRKNHANVPNTVIVLSYPQRSEGPRFHESRLNQRWFQHSFVADFMCLF